MKREMIKNLKKFSLLVGTGYVIDILNNYIADSLIKDNPELQDDCSEYINIVDDYSNIEADGFPSDIIVFQNKEVEGVFKSVNTIKHIPTPNELFNLALNFYLNKHDVDFNVQCLIDSNLSTNSYCFEVDKDTLNELLESDSILSSIMKEVSFIEFNLDNTVLDKLVAKYTCGAVVNCFSIDPNSNFIASKHEEPIKKYLGEIATANKPYLVCSIFSKASNVSNDLIRVPGFTDTCACIRIPLNTFISLICD